MDPLLSPALHVQNEMHFQYVLGMFFEHEADCIASEESIGYTPRLREMSEADVKRFREAFYTIWRLAIDRQFWPVMWDLDSRSKRTVNEVAYWMVDVGLAHAGYQGPADVSLKDWIFALKKVRGSHESLCLENGFRGLSLNGNQAFRYRHTSWQEFLKERCTCGCIDCDPFRVFTDDEAEESDSHDSSTDYGVVPRQLAYSNMHPSAPSFKWDSESVTSDSRASEVQSDEDAGEYVVYDSDDNSEGYSSATDHSDFVVPEVGSEVDCKSN